VGFLAVAAVWLEPAADELSVPVVELPLATELVFIATLGVATFEFAADPAFDPMTPAGGPLFALAGALAADIVALDVDVATREYFVVAVLVTALVDITTAGLARAPECTLLCAIWVVDAI